MNAASPKAATSIPANLAPSIYPAPFQSLVAGRSKRKLGAHYGLNNFGVNLTELAPGAVSALMHHHSTQDEFIYVVSGTVSLRMGEERYTLSAGDCCGFPAGAGLAHQLINESQDAVVYLEIGDRSVDDHAEFPEDDLKAQQLPNGTWRLTRKNGEPY